MGIPRRARRARSPAQDGEPRGARAWPLRAYFVALIVVFVVAALSGAVYVAIQTDHDARVSATRDAAFAANTTSHQLGAFVATMRESVAGLAANPQIGATLAHPKGCTLAFSGIAGPDKGHLDIVRADGTVACSSRAPKRGDRRSPYAGAGWLRRALRGPVLTAPGYDARTGGRAIISADPITGGLGVVVAFGDLPVIARQLVALYGGGRPVELLLTNADGRRVITRSIAPDRWIGASLAGTPFARGAGETERRDLDGRTRYYASASVPGLPWRLYAGEDKTAMLAADGRLKRRELLIVLAGLAVSILGTWLIYRRVAQPITRLARAVRSSDAQAAFATSKDGPSEVVALGTAIDGLISTVGRELRDRERVEEALRGSEESYRQLFEHHPGAMWLYDLETLRFVAVNEAAIASYGYSRAEFLAMTIEDIRLSDDHEALREATSDPLRRYVDAGIWRHRRKDGALIDVSITSNTVEFEGRPARSVLARDVTEQRRLEEQLRQSQKMEAVGNLAGGIAHDFNNLLTVIKGYCAILVSELTDDELSRSAAAIAEAAHRAAELTRQLLAFSRQQVLRPEPTIVNDVIGDTFDLLDRVIGEDIAVEYDLDPDLEPIQVDRGQLGQVILNLAINARDAMPRGGHLTVKTANVDIDSAYTAEHVDVVAGRHVLLQITDSGAGMDETTRLRAFDPFFTTKDDGTGLGLATVYGIVKQSGGHIWLYSEPDTGTTFKIYFPLAGEQRPMLPPPPDEARLLEGTESVLLVEDDHAVRGLVALTLQGYGYTVLEAGSAADALAIAAAPSDFDLLLTDVVMPGMNGRELAEALLADRPSLKVLFTSGYPADTIIRHGIADASAVYLEKPYLPIDLARKLRQVLDTAS